MRTSRGRGGEDEDVSREGQRPQRRVPPQKVGSGQQLPPGPGRVRAAGPGPSEDAAPEAPGVAVPDGVAESQPGPARGRTGVSGSWPTGQAAANDEHARRRDCEAGRVDPDGAGRAQERRDNAGEERAGDARRGRRPGQEPVGLGDAARARTGPGPRSRSRPGRPCRSRRTTGRITYSSHTCGWKAQASGMRPRGPGPARRPSSGASGRAGQPGSRRRCPPRPPATPAGPGQQAHLRDPPGRPQHQQRDRDQGDESPATERVCAPGRR